MSNRHPSQLALGKFQCKSKVKENGSTVTCLNFWREVTLGSGRVKCLGCGKLKHGRMATLVHRIKGVK